MDTNNKVFIAKDSNGREKEYEIIFKFDSDQTKKSYLVYTDHTKENGLMKVFANVYDKTGKNKLLMPIETEEEWNTIETFLRKLEGMIDGEN